MKNNQLTPLNLPTPILSILDDNLGLKVRCLVRQKYVSLLPEEWVRQHLIFYLSEIKGYPLGLMAVEFPLNYAGTSRRADIVVFDRSKKPILVVECKAPNIKIAQNVMDQAAKYNTTLSSGILVISNGLKHFVAEFFGEGEVRFLTDIPMGGIEEKG